MTHLTKKIGYGWKAIQRVSELGDGRRAELVDLDWFGVEVSWADDAALFAGLLNVEIWNGCCVHQRQRKIILSPFRLRLDDEDLAKDIADKIEAVWDHAVGLREFELELDR